MAFKYRLPKILILQFLHDFIKFKPLRLKDRVHQSSFINWGLAKVLLVSLRGAPYEPLSNASLKDLTIKTLFLVSLASVKSGGITERFM